jgi:hypothetical protein
LVRRAVDIVFPTWLLLNSLQRFGAERPRTRVQLLETVLGGTDEALYERAVDLAIGRTCRRASSAAPCSTPATAAAGPAPKGAGRSRTKPRRSPPPHVQASAAPDPLLILVS